MRAKKLPIMKYLSLLIFLPSILVGAEDAIAGFDFLNIPVGARYAAIGGCNFGATGDLATIFSNPAALQTSSKKIGLTYAGYLAGMQGGYGIFTLPYLPCRHPENMKGTLGIGVNYLSSGFSYFEVYDTNNNLAGTFGAYALMPTVGYSLLVGDNAFGLNVKFIYESIADYKSTAMATDLGFMIPIKSYEGLTIGGTLQNVGFQIQKFDTAQEKLPFSASLGGSYSLFNKASQISLQFNLPAKNFIVGVEWHTSPSFTVRGGYYSAGKNELTVGASSDVFAGLTFGVGLNTPAFVLDYASVPKGELGIVHQFSFTFPFPTKK